MISNPTSSLPIADRLRELRDELAGTRPFLAKALTERQAAEDDWHPHLGGGHQTRILKRPCSCLPAALNLSKSRSPKPTTNRPHENREKLSNNISHLRN